MRKYKEIFRLKKMLDDAKIPYEFLNFDFHFEDYTQKGYQLCYPYSFQNKNGLCICSVIEHYGSYGNERDLLEIMGLLTEEENKADSVKGYLTAEDVFARIKSHYKECNKWADT